ncbi:cytochrome c oxidase assembly factor 7-like [Mercenaria mercenaria]|uniref:cytochrome c oxidase assembly factor 7-like n=1 Tax=Mercenaria mercenaria TaxID=6596 RepID=UPI001E1D890D|nr:cytochrome c oxidase assembly factor 7-like [Mercenaria mercenaria]
MQQQPQGKVDHEILEHYYERLEKNNRFHCFERKDPEACHHLGNFLETKKKKFTEAFEVYKDNCMKREYGDSCFQYGQMLYHGTGAEKNILDAYKAHLQGCKVKRYNGGSCDTVALHYIDDNIQPEIKKIRGKKDPKKALELFKKGCDGDDGMACHHAAVAYKNGIENYVKPDPELMFKYAVKACDFRSKVGCKLVADAYKSGIGTQKNDRLYEYYQKQYDLMAGRGVARRVDKNSPSK